MRMLKIVLGIIGAFVVANLVVINVSAQFNTPADPKYPTKIWWTKRITRQFYTAGRLSSRQIKYAAETGFKSVVSLINTDIPGQFGHEVLPDTGETRYLAENVLGVEFHARPGDLQWWSMDAYNDFAAVVKKLPTPILVFCNDTYVATITVLLHVAKLETPPGQDIDTDSIFKIGRAMGHEYETDVKVMSLVSAVTGQRLDIKRAEPSSRTMPDWKKYWPAKYVSSTFFDAGQIWRSHLPRIKEAGFKAVVNVRGGVTMSEPGTPGVIPSQEEVTLLNIDDYTDTYYKGGRHFILRLLETQVDPNKTTDYIYPGSPWPFELQNHEEFGDYVGYNEHIERQAFEEAGIKYYHIGSPYPCGQECVDIFQTNKDEILEIARQHGSVLLHCTLGYRAGFFSVLLEAYSSCRDFEWVIDQARMMGYDFDHTIIDYTAVQDVMKVDRPHCQ